jgi:hypothetical protein
VPDHSAYRGDKNLPKNAADRGVKHAKVRLLKNRWKGGSRAKCIEEKLKERGVSGNEKLGIESGA